MLDARWITTKARRWGRKMGSSAIDRKGRMEARWASRRILGSSDRLAVFVEMAGRERVSFGLASLLSRRGATFETAEVLSRNSRGH
jgi:hypothetical protein